MVTIHDTELKSGILQGITKANELGRPVLVSEVIKIEPMDPLSFYNRGTSLFSGERFYWRNPSGDFFLAGLGIAASFSTNGEAERFKAVDTAWRQFIMDAIVHNAYECAGAGPLAMGGFSFDPLKERTPLWSKFPDSLFHVPKFLLTYAGKEAFLTTNVVCSRNDSLELYSKVTAERGIILSGNGRSDAGQAALMEIKEIAAPEWKRGVQDVVDVLGNSELKKVVLARELRLTFDKKVETGSLLADLQEQQQTSFIFSFESGGDSFIGASPERLVKKDGQAVHSACLAGSIPRGKTPDEDKVLGSLLLADEKNLAEHQYVVDMIKEAMEETCKSVDIPLKPQLMKVRDIQHLYTPVKATAKQGASLLSIVGRLHPTPALGGMPKELAMEKIRVVEDLDRGYFAAPIGWMDYEGNGEFAVAIRSGLIQGREASLFAGCGVVENSDPESEYLETALKFRPMLTALGGNKE